MKTTLTALLISAALITTGCESQEEALKAHCKELTYKDKMIEAGIYEDCKAINVRILGNSQQYDAGNW